MLGEVVEDEHSLGGDMGQNSYSIGGATNALHDLGAHAVVVEVHAHAVVVEYVDGGKGRSGDGARGFGHLVKHCGQIKLTAQRDDGVHQGVRHGVAGAGSLLLSHRGLPPGQRRQESQGHESR